MPHFLPSGDRQPGYRSIQGGDTPPRPSNGLVTSFKAYALPSCCYKMLNYGHQLTVPSRLQPSTCDNAETSHYCHQPRLQRCRYVTCQGWCRSKRATIRTTRIAQFPLRRCRRSPLIVMSKPTVVDEVLPTSSLAISEMRSVVGSQIVVERLPPRCLRRRRQLAHIRRQERRQQDERRCSRPNCSPPSK